MSALASTARLRRGDMLARMYASDATADGPDRFYAGYDPDARTVTRLAELIRREPGRFRSSDDLVRVAGVGATKLHALFRRHYHTTPLEYLHRARIAAACQRLADARADINEVAFAVGYESVSTFYDRFLRLVRMSPGEYRALDAGAGFRLRLPRDYAPSFALRVLGRDGASRTEGVTGIVAWKALRFGDDAGVLRIELRDSRAAHCTIEAPHALAPDTARTAHRVALRLLGLHGDPAPFERRVTELGEQRLIDRRRGLRVPLTADAWEALVWSIIGQQVNLAFACALRRELIALAGEHGANGCVAHPTAGAIARLDYADLTRRRFSARKAEYLIDLARRVVARELVIDELDRARATDIEQRLLAERGIGPWSAHYVLMRGLGFADCVPIGDSALATALQRYRNLEQRPDAQQTAELMQPFTPYRSLATCHFWQFFASAA
jgi:AraC family transcriptional regulator, regulatory protein of adaptative response / DNA-3-methyladenine glycosylase II